jgi:amidase
MQANKPALGPGIAERMHYASTVTAEMETAARKIFPSARTHIRTLVPPGTVLCLPTAPCIATRTDAGPQELDVFRTRAMSITCIAGIGGLPEVSIPAVTVEGCPAGLSFIGWPGADETLLDLAVTLAPYCGA